MHGVERESHGPKNLMEIYKPSKRSGHITQLHSMASTSRMHTGVHDVDVTAWLTWLCTCVGYMYCRAVKYSVTIAFRHGLFKGR